MSNQAFTSFPGDDCVDPTIQSIGSRAALKARSNHGITRRQTIDLTPGYVTTDDFGSNGDDTPHSKIPFFVQPTYIAANASFPASVGPDQAVDVVFLDFIAPNVLAALASVGANYTRADVRSYLPTSFTSNQYLPEYAKIAWQANVPNCPVG